MLLECTCQILNILLLLNQVDVHLLGLRAKTSVFISRDVVLDLQVTIHIPKVFFLGLAEDGCLVGLHHVRAVCSMI